MAADQHSTVSAAHVAFSLDEICAIVVNGTASGDFVPVLLKIVYLLTGQ